MQARTEDIGSDAELLAVARFRLALRLFEQRTDTLVRQCGLTPRRYLLLLTVRAAEADVGYATVTSTGRDMAMPQSTTADLVSRAVDVGLLEKHASAHCSKPRRPTATDTTGTART